MNRVLIIGGGFAGLSAAVYLSGYGFKVKLFESSSRLGGRAYSFKDESTGDIIDNGQHIMMGCYKETLKFLTITDSIKNLSIQKKIKINFSHREMGIVPLSAVTGFYPLNLMLALLRLKTLTWTERLSVLKFFIRLKLNISEDLSTMSVKEWLEKEGQSPNTIKSLWEIITVGALNTHTSKASALIFADILKRIFFTGSASTGIIIPAVGLSEMYCTGAEQYIRSKGGDICVSSRVEKIIMHNEQAIAVLVDGKEYKEFDYLISAIPFFAINRLFNTDIINTDNYTPSPILSVHIWLDENPLREQFYGIINSEVQWVFNHKSHITIVISNADNFTEKSREEIFSLVLQELMKHFHGISQDSVLNYRIIKEKRATFIPHFKILNSRPDTKTNISNLFLAGDWVNTGLPATIESAVKSGRLAAEALISSNK